MEAALGGNSGIACLGHLLFPSLSLSLSLLLSQLCPQQSSAYLILCASSATELNPELLAVSLLSWPYQRSSGHQ